MIHLFGMIYNFFFHNTSRSRMRLSLRFSLPSNNHKPLDPNIGAPLLFVIMNSQLTKTNIILV